METAKYIAFIMVFATGLLCFALFMLKTIDGIIDRFMKIFGMGRKTNETNTEE